MKQLLEVLRQGDTKERLNAWANLSQVIATALVLLSLLAAGLQIVAPHLLYVRADWYVGTMILVLGLVYRLRAYLAADFYEVKDRLGPSVVMFLVSLIFMIAEYTVGTHATGPRAGLEMLGLVILFGAGNVVWRPHLTKSVAQYSRHSCAFFEGLLRPINDFNGKLVDALKVVADRSVADRAELEAKIVQLEQMLEEQRDERGKGPGSRSQEFID
jgi:hypothetical protein